MDRLTTLDLFVRIVDAGSFAAGAEQLGLSRALASRAILDLETRLGTRLLNRTTRRLSLTEAGAAFYRRAQRITADVVEAEEEAAALHARPRGLLRVNAPMSFGVLHVAPAMAGYLERYPEVSVDLTLNDRVVDLLEDGTDLAIRIGRLADSSLIARRLAPCRILLCAAPSYLAAHGTPAHPSELIRHRCIAYAYGGDRGEWVLTGPEGEVRIRIGARLQINNGDAIQAAIREGYGIARQPDFIAAPDLAAGRMVQILPEWRLPELGIHAVYPPARTLSAKVRSFVDFLAERFARPSWSLDSRS
ncbi:LysR family transcriptional regulator [Mycobacterium sp. KBS0706]|uniref:LysR family transcriptional regulator n=1 Tax=Mycobacterium sp. KBS0706 TaxID=2578109 RepID=UPI00110FCB10|nr:LysR family transcriptional regulator [Mycobacterium sp. KBS0706]TSD84808.1 LysR family transcriptional regulator [Mycobacterium sp. KBS0706]